jgi:hypothetical protein
MNAFLQQHAKVVSGMISGWDRLRFRGTLMRICHPGGLSGFFHASGKLFSQFKEFALASSAQLKQAALAAAQELGRPVMYLPTSRISKEEVARQCARDDGITQGLICCITALEPCSSLVIRKDKATGRFDFKSSRPNCLHVYHYYMHPIFGFMHVRLQTWLPFSQFICINGREWLCRSLDAAGIAYLRKENCLLQVDDVAAAQRLLDEQVHFDWQPTLDKIADWIAPNLQTILSPVPMSYYWSVAQSEWASDFMFNRTADLDRLYPSLLRHAMTSFASRDLLRFLGKKVPLEGHCLPNCTAEVTSDLLERAQGIRVKHRVRDNSIKMYNKQGSVLRVETTLNDVSQLKSPRRQEDGSVEWKRLRKGVVDARQRAQASDAANGRYIDAIATVSSPITLASLTTQLCYPTTWKKQRVRGLNLLHQDDARLLETLGKGEFLLNGLRNRDLQAVFFPDPTDRKKEKRRRSAAISRKLRMLRAHGLLSKLPRTHRYTVSDKGRRLITALIAVRQTDINQLPKAA